MREKTRNTSSHVLASVLGNKEEQRGRKGGREGGREGQEGIEKGFGRPLLVRRRTIYGALPHP
jgi:predicted transposase YdaD